MISYENEFDNFLIRTIFAAHTFCKNGVFSTLSDYNKNQLNEMKVSLVIVGETLTFTYLFNINEKKFFLSLIIVVIDIEVLISLP